ncbi:MAG: hypothetical protein JWO80_1298 [Bryobacterales bacterium]|nr:hypothetical protein [Bryobacterales bacterium]
MAQTAPVLHAFGDSITVGGKASDIATKSYIHLVAAATGWPLVNLANSGDQGADTAVKVYGATVNANDIYSLMIGATDEWIYGTDASRRGIFAGAHMAELAWLSIPAAQKITAHSGSVNFSGSWSDSTLYPGLGMQSRQTGSTAAFMVTGSTVLIGMSLSDDRGGCQLMVSIDGTGYGAWNSSPATVIQTYKGTNFAPFLVRANGLPAGPHRVSLSVGSCASPKGYAYFDWAAGVGERSGDGSWVQRAKVYVMNVPGKAASFYAKYPGGGDANVDDYNLVIAANVAALAQKGLPIQLVDVFGKLNTTDDLDADGIHPNDAGHALIARAFLDVIAGAGTVSISPPSVTLRPGESTQFSAANSAFTGDSFSWSLSQPVGAISASGKYTAPDSADDSTSGVQVIATSVSAPTASGSAKIGFASLSAGSLDPQTGKGPSATFQFDVSNGQNTSTLKSASVLISTGGVTASGMCMVKYDVATGAFYLRKDNPSGAATLANPDFWAGSAAAGSNTVLSNSQCTIVAVISAATTDSSGTSLHLAVRIAFPSSRTGRASVYLSADDTLGMTRAGTNPESGRSIPSLSPRGL